MRALKFEVQRQMNIHGDYKGWYHRLDIARYSRMQRRADIENQEQQVSIEHRKSSSRSWDQF